MKAVLLFYRNFSVPALLLSALGCFLMIRTGIPLSLVYVFWLKIWTSILFGLYVHFFRSASYVFYHNLGFSIVRLYTFTLLIDFGIWLIMSLLSILIFMR